MTVQEEPATTTCTKHDHDHTTLTQRKHENKTTCYQKEIDEIDAIEGIENKIKTLEKKLDIDVRVLFCFHELEEWRKDNPWIKTGYRVTTNSYYLCLKTLFFLHNETGNIWSHLFGGMLFVYLSFYTLREIVVTGWLDQLIFSFFLLGAIGCFLFSGFFHLFSCHSHQVCLAWNKCDYVGIMLMIVGSSYPLIYYGFHCHPYHQLLYLGLISFFGLSSVPILIMDHFATPK